MPEGAGKRKRPRVQLVEVLIGAVCAGGSRLARARSEFERMDATDGLQRLVLQAVDPELLAAVVGPGLVSRWVAPLRAQYAAYKKAYPADWVDVEKVWREQRARWRRPAGTAASGSASVSPAVSRGYPHRVVDPARSGPPAGGRGPAPAVRGSGPARKAPPAHRPVPAGVAPLPDPDVESVAAPPDVVLSGGVADELATEVVQQERERHEASHRESARATDSARSGRAPLPGGVNGAPAVPPRAPRPASASPGAPSSEGSTASSDSRIVFSGGAGALVERLLQAMADSRASVESVRRVWIDADGVAGGWDLWALDPVVIDRVRALRRGVER